MTDSDLACLVARGISPSDIVVPSQVYAQLIETSKGKLPAETAGILIGDYQADDRGSLATIQAAVPVKLVSTGFGLAPSTDAWQELLSSLPPEQQVLGWFYADSCIGVFGPRLDIGNIQSTLAASTQLFLLANPVSGRIALYNVQSNYFSRLSGFYEGQPSEDALPLIPAAADVPEADTWMDQYAPPLEKTSSPEPAVPPLLLADEDDAGAAVSRADSEADIEPIFAGDMAGENWATDHSVLTAIPLLLSGVDLQAPADAEVRKIEQWRSVIDFPPAGSAQSTNGAVAGRGVSRERAIQVKSRTSRKHGTRRISLLLGVLLPVLVVLVVVFAWIRFAHSPQTREDVSAIVITASASPASTGISTVTANPGVNTGVNRATSTPKPRTTASVVAGTPPANGGVILASPTPTSLPATTIPATATTAQQFSPHASPTSAAPDITYVVQAGDTLSDIAGSYNVSVAAIMRANNLPSDAIYTGESLVMPPGTQAPVGAPTSVTRPASTARPVSTVTAASATRPTFTGAPTSTTTAVLPTSIPATATTSPAHHASTETPISTPHMPSVTPAVATAEPRVISTASLTPETVLPWLTTPTAVVFPTQAVSTPSSTTMPTEEVVAPSPTQVLPGITPTEVPPTIIVVDTVTPMPAEPTETP